ncbi:MAG TPA: hypothetical protein VI112_11715, partial [Bacteroidia bacterium]
MKRIRLLLFLVLCALALGFTGGETRVEPPFVNDKAERWADSVMKTMTPEERIGQLFMVAAYS